MDLSRSPWVTPIGALLALLGFAVGFPLAGAGFDEVQELRRLERLPVSQRAGAVLPGDAALRAPAQADGIVLRSPRTGTPSLYYRYLHEVETRDGDGDRSWRTRTDRSEAVDFVLADASGRIRVPAQRDFVPAEFSAPQRHRVTRGRDRYTEWRIEPGDRVLVVGTARLAPAGMEIDLRDASGPPGIVSGFDADAERRRAGRGGIFRLWGGLALLAVGVFGLALAARIHRVLAYLTILGLVLGLTLVQFGVRMTAEDLRRGLAAQEVRETAARARFARFVEALGPGAADLRSLPPLSDPRFDGLAFQVRANLQAVREELETARLRLDTQFRRFPERLLAPLLGIEAPASASFLPGSAGEALAARLADRAPTRLTSAWVVALAWLAVLLAGVATWFGFRRVQLKRRIENLAVSKTTGAACGLTELSGEIEMAPGEDPIEAPHSYRECVWYDFRVEEKRRSGKKTRWVTIEERQAGAPFLCRDDAGTLRVDPGDAEILTRHRTRERRGDRRYHEARLEIGDRCYLLGPTAVHGEAADRLCMRAGADDEPFLIANLPERSVMLRKAFVGLAWLNLALTALALGLLLLLAAAGSFSPADFLVAGLVAPVYMALVMFVLHYNDLLFLRERARRNWANVQVSLRKRRNLVRPLGKLVAGYLEHERTLQERLARLRTELRTATDDPAAAARYLEAERALDGELRAVIENYPRLRGAKAVAQLTAALTRLENEVALMRSGYNDAVEHYNARIASFPDVLLARPLKFERMDFVAS